MHAYDEISLVIFTLLAQMAVGIVLVGQLALAGNYGDAETPRVRRQGYFALAFIIAAAIISCFHLGTPLHAPFTIFNVGSSWLSREILLLILTALSLGCMVYFGYKDAESSTVRIFAIISCCVGLLLLYSMSRIYASPFMPGWDHSSTFFLFLASALILGALWQAWAVGTDKKGGENKNTVLLRIFFMAAAGFVLLAIFVPIALPRPNPLVNPISQENSIGQIISAQTIHTLLTGLGILTLFIAIWRSLKNQSVTLWLSAGFILALAGEIAGRYAFYMSYSRLGM